MVLGVKPTSQDDNSYLSLLFALFYIPINIFFVVKFGGTPGKLFYGLRIVKNDAYPKIGTAIIRQIFGSIASGVIFNLGYIWAAFDKEKRGWHDLIAGTHVILLRPVTGFKKVSIYLLTLFPLMLVPLAILSAIALIAINPAKQFSQADNVARRSSIQVIANAIGEYSAQNGTLPGKISTTEQTISTAEADICQEIINYLPGGLPIDPQQNSGGFINDCSAVYDTGYVVVYSALDNTFTVSAPLAGLQEEISVSRNLPTGNSSQQPQ
jgi:type IV pilus assembly protein PilA